MDPRLTIFIPSVLLWLTILPETGETVILLVHQAMHIPHLPHNLISPMQLWLNDVLVNNKLKFLTENPTAEDHAIIVTGDNPMDRLLIPLSLNGVTSIFYTQKPMVQEYETCQHYELTYEEPKYNPSDTHWAEQEAICAWLAKHSQTGDGLPMQHLHSLHQLHLVSKSLMHVTAMYSANCQSDLLLNAVLSTLIDCTFLTDIQDAVQIHSIKTIHKEPINPHTLASNWGIGIKTAKQTLRVTTQHRL